MVNELLGDDRQAWADYFEEHGPEAYKYRRLYERLVREIQNLYTYADEHDIELPSPGPGIT